MHPLPMALLGIAGEVAFLRSANGQTGMVKEGDSLGDLKLPTHRYQPRLDRAGRTETRTDDFLRLRRRQPPAHELHQ